jgi:hypothetical protein
MRLPAAISALVVVASLVAGSEQSPTQTQIQDGTSNTIVVSEKQPTTGSGGARPAGGGVTIADGSSNTIVVAEPSGNGSSGSGSSGSTSNITDGTSNTLFFGEGTTAQQSTTPSAGSATTTGGATNGVAVTKATGITTAPVTAQAPPPPPKDSKIANLTIVVPNASTAKKAPEPVAGGDKIDCKTGTTLRDGLLVTRLAAERKGDKANALLAAQQAALMTAQLSRNGCKA